jgi:hypothetical protein
MYATHIFATCTVCGDRIGIYEPVSVLSQGTVRESSLAREPELRYQNEAMLMHPACAAGGQLSPAPAAASG